MNIAITEEKQDCKITSMCLYYCASRKYIYYKNKK